MAEEDGLLVTMRHMPETGLVFWQGFRCDGRPGSVKDCGESDVSPRDVWDILPVMPRRFHPKPEKGRQSLSNAPGGGT